MNINYKGYIAHFGLAVLLAVAVYAALDFLILLTWDSEESRIVEVIDIGKAVDVTGESDDRYDEDEESSPYRTIKTDIAVNVLTGEQRGEFFSLPVTQMAGSGVELKKGGRYILLVDVFEDDTMQYSIADTFRVSSVAGVVVFACACLAAFAGEAGIRAMLGLGISIAFLLWGYVPLAAGGWAPVPFAFLTSFAIAGVTVSLVVHRKQSRIVAFLGTMGGVGGAFLLGFMMVHIWQLSGLSGDGAALLASTLPDIDLRGILLASIIISSIGAVLDVGISITASMSELIEYDPKISTVTLWSSGIRVGSEVLGSMINTLILAYLGTSLPIAILISNAGADFWGLMNDPYVGQEIVQSIAGTSGLLLTIPITATLFALRERWLEKWRKGKTKGSVKNNAYHK